MGGNTSKVIDFVVILVVDVYGSSILPQQVLKSICSQSCIYDSVRYVMCKESCPLGWIILFKSMKFNF